MHNILVTGIGGNVGYGILRNIKQAFGDSVRLIGTNTVKVSAGNHMCHEVYEVPFSLDAAYIPAVKRICIDHDVSLIIPSTDYETYILACNQNELPPVAVSPASTSKIFLDKYLSYQHLSKVGLNFAESILPSEYVNNFSSFIVKPREGRGSRNLHLNPEKPGSFTDDYVIQPLLTGKEITTAFYITKNNELHGHITLERELMSGATNSCEVVTEYDTELSVYINKLITSFEIKGSCNIQSIVTKDGIVPFEVNCRISGTNSIRSQFGFKDVAYTIDEWLYGKTPEKPSIIHGCAVRILSDIIYQGSSLKDINNNSDSFYIYG